jgi:hypothetical protein
MNEMRKRNTVVIAGVLSVAVALGLSACASRTLTGHVGPSTGRSTNSAKALPNFGAREVVGAHGSSAWRYTADNLAVSDSAGAQWKVTSYPPGVTSDLVQAVTTAPDGTTWIATSPADGSIDIYRLAPQQSSWTKTALVPQWPADIAGASGPPSSILMNYNVSGILTVLAQIQLTGTSSIPRLFVSVDSGMTFAQRATPDHSIVNTPWSSVIFSSPLNGVAITGPSQQNTVFTVDGGVTWQQAAVVGTSGSSDVAIGQSQVSNGEFVEPVSTVNSDGTKTLQMENSTTGASFNPVGLPLKLGTVAGTPTVSESGSNWWVLGPVGTILESANNGGSWSSVTATGLPSGGGSLALNGSSQATFAWSSIQCADGKSNCTSVSGTYVTSDGGRHWTQIS